MTQKQRNDRYNLTINRGLFDNKKNRRWSKHHGVKLKYHS